MVWIFAEVAPPPEVLIPAEGIIEAGIGGLVGMIAKAIPWWRDALVASIKWIARHVGEGLHIVWGFILEVNQGVANVRSWATSEIQGLVHAVAQIHPTTIVQVTSSAAAALDQVYRTIDGAEHYAISVAEDLYNRAVAYTASAESHVYDAAWSWVQSAIAIGASAVGEARTYTTDLHNLTWGHVDQVERTLNDTVSQAQAATVGYLDDVVGGVERDLEGLKVWVNGAMALFGAEIFARVITTVKSLYDPCCEFTTDQVKPQWGKVKNLLGKLTRRGPLALVVLGAASEAVVALDRPAIVAALKQARREDHGVSLAVLKDWQRPGVA